MTQSKGGGVALAVSAVVVFAVSPARLRLLVPTAARGRAGRGRLRPLTAPFLERGARLSPTRAAGGGTLLVLTVAGRGRRRRATRCWTGGSSSGPGCGARSACSSSPPWSASRSSPLRLPSSPRRSPGRYVGDRWRAFKHAPDDESGSSHLLSLGSNRYDFWRVALKEFREHPRRRHRRARLRASRTCRAPQRRDPGPRALARARRAERARHRRLRSCSSPALVPLLADLLPRRTSARTRARPRPSAAAAYWLVHASGDWIWTFPAVGLPFFLLLGIGGCRGRTAGRCAGAVAAGRRGCGRRGGARLRAALAVGAAHRARARGLRRRRRRPAWATPPRPALGRALRRPRQHIARTPAAAIPPLRRPRSKEPRVGRACATSSALAYLRAGRDRRGTRASCAPATRARPGRRPIDRARRQTRRQRRQ